jgi:hypothetical protein
MQRVLQTQFINTQTAQTPKSIVSFAGDLAFVVVGLDKMVFEQSEVTKLCGHTVLGTLRKSTHPFQRKHNRLYIVLDMHSVKLCHTQFYRIFDTLRKNNGLIPYLPLCSHRLGEGLSFCLGAYAYVHTKMKQEATPLE